MTDQPEIPHRRHRLELKLEADDIPSLLSALAAVEYDLLVKEREHDWSQPIEITSGGYDSGWHLNVTSDLTIDGDTYRASLMAWRDADRAARRANDLPHQIHNGDHERVDCSAERCNLDPISEEVTR